VRTCWLDRESVSVRVSQVAHSWEALSAQTGPIGLTVRDEDRGRFTPGDTKERI
jgi:hypothetical protein